MNRFAWAVVVAVGVAAAGRAEPPKPAVEVRLVPAVDLVPLIEYGGGLFGQADAAKQFADIVKLLADNPDQSMGFDLKKPVGAYAVLADKVEDSTVVLMVPITDEDTFVGTLKDKFNLDPKKDAKTGTYGVDVPGFPDTVYFRVADGYAHLTLKTADGVDKAKLIAPKTFFAEKTTGVLSAKVYFDHIPADLRKAAYGQFELQVKEQGIKSTDPISKRVEEFVTDAGVDAVKTLLTDGDTLSVTLDVDPKADDLKVSLAVTPKKGTTLAKTLALWADRDSVPATVTAAKTPLLAAGVNFALPPETTKKLAALVDGIAKDAIDAAKESDRPVLKMIADAVLPTLKAGDAQLGLVATDAGGGKIGLNGAVKAVGGKEVEKTAKLFALMLPKEQGEFTADADKVGGRNLHTLKFAKTDGLPFASDTLWLLTSDDLLAFSSDAKGDGVKAVGGAKAAKAPMLSFEVSAVQFSRVTNAADAEVIKNVVNSVFDGGKSDGLDTFTLTARGGKQLTLDLTLKGKALAFLVAMGQSK